MHASTVISVNRLSFGFNETPVLRNLSFQVLSGECLLILGENGAGKSTLLKCLSRIYETAAGKIDILGRSLREYSHSELARVTAYLPQQLSIRVPYKVEEVVGMGRYAHRSAGASTPKQDEDAISSALEDVGLSDFRYRSIGDLSGGERQKVFIAACLAQQSSILLLDEPTTFLDPRHQLEIGELLLRLRKERSLTLVWVTHEINLAASYASRILALKGGELLFNGSSKDFMTPDVLSAVYGRQFTLAPAPNRDLSFIIPN